MPRWNLEACHRNAGPRYVRCARSTAWLHIIHSAHLQNCRFACHLIHAVPQDTCRILGCFNVLAAICCRISILRVWWVQWLWIQCRRMQMADGDVRMLWFCNCMDAGPCVPFQMVCARGSATVAPDRDRRSASSGLSQPLADGFNGVNGMYSVDCTLALLGSQVGVSA